MSKLDPLSDTEQAVIDRIRDRSPHAWRQVVLRFWDGQNPIGTSSFLGDDERATLQRMRNRRGPTWLGSYRP